MINKGYFRLARNVSKESTHRYKLGAVISKGKPISIGFNKRKTHPKYTVYEKVGGIHAEVSAIINAGRHDLKGSSIYIYRETENGKPANARPCDRCLVELRHAGIKWIYYTTHIPPYWVKERI